MFDLTSEFGREAFAKQVLEDIDEYCIKTYDKGHRKHLGASEIGHPCARYLWYTFRWVFHKQFSGRMHRLFNRGHREEARYIEWLRGIGFEVWDVAPDTGEQFRIKGARGHFGGSLDSVGKPPSHYIFNEPIALLFEYKTNSTGRGFSDLLKHKVKKSKPTHYVQMCNYGKRYGFKYALYFNTNKNDDDMHVECIELDWAVADHSEYKANEIIFSRLPPARIAENPAYETCTYCDFQGICFRNERVEINCRSCKHAEPIDEGAWFCHQYNNIIPEDFIPKGCGAHLSINT